MDHCILYRLTNNNINNASVSRKGKKKTEVISTESEFL
jgi:hypothetical protein